MEQELVGIKPAGEAQEAYQARNGYEDDCDHTTTNLLQFLKRKAFRPGLSGSEGV